jgi:hypothetical protein
VIVVPQNTRRFPVLGQQIPSPFNAKQWFCTVAHDIAAADQPINRIPSKVSRHGFQCFEVAVDI